MIAEPPLLPPRYCFVGEIARGGMGVVLRVVDIDLDRPLAVKLLLRPDSGPMQQDRFLAEARITGRLQHPGIPPVHEVGRLADGCPFFSMKLIEGSTLLTLLRERPTPSADLPRFVKIFEQICQTVAYAHSQGIIHRDLKPANIMVGAFGEVQVMDWGLAKEIRSQSQSVPADRKPMSPQVRELDAFQSTISRVAENLDSATIDQPQDDRTSDWASGNASERTTDGQVLGTLRYMPPEQANGLSDQINERADVFGLGAILCEILTGNPPYAARGNAELFRQARDADLTDAIARLEQSGADSTLISLAKNFLAADPFARPNNAQAAAAQVTDYLNSVQEQFRKSELERAAAQARASAERTKRRWQLALASLAGVVLLAITVGAFWTAENRAIRDQRRATLADDVTRELSALAAQREQLQSQLADCRLASMLLSDMNGWKTQVERMRDSWQRTENLRKASDDLLDENFVRQIAEGNEWLLADEQTWKIAKQLDNIRLEAGMIVDGQLQPKVAVRKYPKVFAQLHMDLEHDSLPEVVEQIRRSPIRFALVAALDHWASVLPQQDELVPRLLEIARLVDPDPEWGDQVRDGRSWANKDQLKALAAKGAPEGASAPLVLLLAGKVNAYDNSAAIALVNAAILEQPRDFWLHYDLGLLVKDAGERVGCFQAALALRPDASLVNGNLGWALFLKGDNDGALRCYRKAIEQSPDVAVSQMGYGAMLREKKDFDGAMRAFEKAVQLEPNFAAAHHNLGLGHFDRKEYEEALRCYNRAIEIDPNMSQTRNCIGAVLMATNDFEGAVSQFKKGIEIEPGYAVSHYNLGVAYQKLGKYKEALKSFQKCHELGDKGPGWNVPSELKARECEQLIELEAKLPAILKGEIKPRDAEEQLAYGKLCRDKLQFASAARYFDAALAADPKLATGWNRYDGACLALLAASGLGRDAKDLTEMGKTLLRQLALRTLRTELADLKGQASTSPAHAAEVQNRLRHWLVDSDLISIRETQELAKLPKTECKDWQSLWDDVALLLEKLRLDAQPKR